MSKNDARTSEEATEQTPLLSSPSPTAAAAAEAARDEPTPLPKLKIALLSLTRFADPLSFSILFPFVNQ